MDPTSTSRSRRNFLARSAALAAAGTFAPGITKTTPSWSADDGGTSPWQLGCFTRPFAQFTYAEALQGIAAAGFSAVGLMSARLTSGNVNLANANEKQRAEIRDGAAEHNLAIAATYYGGPPVQESLAAGVEALRQLIDHCHHVGCATILLGGTGNESLVDRYYEAVKTVCDEAAEKQVALVLKPHGGLNATGPECRRIVEQVGHPAFRIWYDPGNIFHYSEGELDPLEDVASVDGWVTGMCVKDFQPPRGVAVNPGSGQVDFVKLMKRLRAGGFESGPLIVETLAPGDLQTTKSNARQARRFLESVLEA